MLVDVLTETFRPAADCMQYFTGDVGTFSSFNFLGGLLTQNQNYAICIRKNKGLNGSLGSRGHF